MLLRELTQYTVDEAKKRRRKARRTTGMSAAYGPGPYGGYGYAVGYSGDSGGGDGGGGGESIHELFDGGKDWKWTYQDKNQAMAAFTVGDVDYTFSAGQDPDEAPGDWDVEFAAKKEAGTASWGVTGTGNSAQVFGTVVEIMKAFIAGKKSSIRRMTFAAKEDSRQGLYARMVKRLLPKWNLEQNGEAFVLTRPGGLVFWVYSVEAPYNKIPAVKVKANSAQEAEQMVLTTMPEFKGADRMGMGASKNKPNLGESRSNPDQNPKPESGMKELVAVAKTIADPENWAVSMTGEAKLGINPQVGISEDTPKGIYFYPLDYAVDLARRGKKLPWGDNMPYIQLFQYDRSGEMTKETSVDSAQLKQALLQYCPAEVIQQAIDEPEYDGTPYWFIYDCLSRLGKSDETNVVRWNKVLRDLGFTSVFDNGAGWIAYNEPTQGVVLDPRVIKQHKTIVNKQQSRVVTPAVIERAIFDTLDMELAANRAWQKYDPDGTKLRTAAKEYAKKPEFKQWFGKPATEEIFDKAASWGRYGARELSQEAWEWFKAQQAQNVAENFADGKLDKTLNETAMMGKIEDSGKIIRILKKAHTVPFSDEKNWLLVDMDPAKGNKGLGIKWIPADTRFEWVRPYRDTVDENTDNDAAKEYRAHLIKTLPQIMKLFANIGKGWIPSKEQMLNAVDTAYRVMKHTGDAKQAGKVLMDELNTLYRMSQGKKGIDENFADGRNPQDKGDSKRHGVPTKGSVSSLRKVAKQGGRKGQLAHWMANMKAGKKKSLNEAVIHPGVMDALEDFLPFVMKLLKLDKLPRISVHKTIETGDQPSFGGYDMENNSIQLALKDRHPADILRTLAHELVHYKQNTTHELDDRSGLTGSPEENEANSKAGVIMRHFNKRFPQYLE